ncbi:hypothetical protein AVEN_128840-1 [Araneus ventricosus]|uniref:Uncharacterized protein n=1 Tax=Araneus ventricosus TaxID=182803 RepID=A0A4Y2TSL1_ARAVE|nr:hypothetical protein AVEN_128840-1 [Araneus ventricosus]
MPNAFVSVKTRWKLTQTNCEFGIPTRLVFHSARSVIIVKYDSWRRVLGWDRWDVEYKCELRLDWRNQGREERVNPSRKYRPPPCVGWGGVVFTLAAGGSRGSELPIVLFGASVNYKLKSIDLNRLKQT